MENYEQFIIRIAVPQGPVQGADASELVEEEITPMLDGLSSAIPKITADVEEMQQDFVTFTVYMEGVPLDTRESVRAAILTIPGWRILDDDIDPEEEDGDGDDEDAPWRESLYDGDAAWPNNDDGMAAV